MIDRYIGRTVEIIYLDRKGSFTKRQIHVVSIQDGVVKAYCYDSQGPRIFQLKNVLAVDLIRSRGA